jgi:hypothetical protein
MPQMRPHRAPAARDDSHSSTQNSHAFAERERLRREFNRWACARQPIPGWLRVGLYRAAAAAEREAGR